MVLFEKYEGRDFWVDSVDVFYTRFLEDPQLCEFIAGKDANKVKSMIMHLLERAFGCNTEEFFMNVGRVHARMAVHGAAFYALWSCFLQL